MNEPIEKKTLTQINEAVKEGFEQALSLIEDQELKDQLTEVWRHHQQTGGDWLILSVQFTAMKWRDKAGAEIVAKAMWAKYCQSLVTKVVTWQ